MKNIVVISVSKFIDLNIKRISINNIYIENRQSQFVIVNNDYTMLEPVKLNLLYSTNV